MAVVGTTLASIPYFVIESLSLSLLSRFLLPPSLFPSLLCNCPSLSLSSVIERTDCFRIRSVNGSRSGTTVAFVLYTVIDRIDPF